MALLMGTLFFHYRWEIEQYERAALTRDTILFSGEKV
jgi:hypothetical protein